MNSSLSALKSSFTDVLIPDILSLFEDVLPGRKFEIIEQNFYHDIQSENNDNGSDAFEQCNNCLLDIHEFILQEADVSFKGLILFFKFILHGNLYPKIGRNFGFLPVFNLYSRFEGSLWNGDNVVDRNEDDIQIEKNLNTNEMLNDKDRIYENDRIENENRLNRNVKIDRIKKHSLRMNEDIQSFKADKIDTDNLDMRITDYLDIRFTDNYNHDIRVTDSKNQGIQIADSNNPDIHIADNGDRDIRIEGGGTYVCLNMQIYLYICM
jgi:hypothetical protein